MSFELFLFTWFLSGFIAINLISRYATNKWFISSPFTVEDLLNLIISCLFGYISLIFLVFTIIVLYVEDNHDKKLW